MQITKVKTRDGVDLLGNSLDQFLTPPKFGWEITADLYEENGNLLAIVTLPGFKSENIRTTIENNTLIISGHREEEKEFENKSYYSKEILHGSFTRAISLPKPVDFLTTDARFENGLLYVKMPILEGEKSIDIPIKNE